MRNKGRVLAVALIALIFTCTLPRRRAAWTLMVYLNGDNDLEEFIRRDFEELARVGSTQDVNIVVQYDGSGMGECRDNLEPDEETWPETLRFRITKGMSPRRRYAYENLCEKDMADGATLGAFVKHSVAAYPAERYALIMVGHGWGPRLLFAPLVRSVGVANPDPNKCSLQFLTDANRRVPRSVPLNAYRTGSNDNFPPGGRKLLFNRDMAESVKAALGTLKLDLLVFDECAMGMIETGYAMRKIADVMVASEELVPGDGIPIRGWLNALVLMPRMPARTLASLIVRTYQAKYFLTNYTMSAYDLREMTSLARAISALSTALAADLQGQWSAVFAARKECLEYGIESKMHHIDLERFCFRLALKTNSWKVRVLALEVIAHLRGARIANGPSALSAWCWGSHGLAIYFPSDALTYCQDGLTQCGYEPTNKYFPVEFVDDSTWSHFLHEYYSIVIAANDPGRPPRPEAPTPFNPGECQQRHWRCNDNGPLRHPPRS